MLTVSRSGSRPAASRGDGYHHGDLRRALIEAGRGLLEEKGVDGLTLRGAARRARVSQTAPYHHFADKAELVGGIAENGFEEFAAALRAGAGAGGESALQRLTGMGLAYVRFAVSNPQVFRLLFRPELRGGKQGGPVAAAVDRAGSAAYQVFLDAVKAAVEKGLVRGSVDDVAAASLSIVHGLSTLLIDGPLDVSRRPPDKLARVVLYALGAGIVSGE